ncbi:hypothetical protein F4677DRAFT_407926 [Hypoxylon crocopeplum]|nr:hypothetical protein F4677DRAFT_407926 [Hypoxylon crocopeplum]
MCLFLSKFTAWLCAVKLLHSGQSMESYVHVGENRQVLESAISLTDTLLSIREKGVRWYWWISKNRKPHLPS